MGPVSRVALISCAISGMGVPAVVQAASVARSRQAASDAPRVEEWIKADKVIPDRWSNGPLGRRRYSRKDTTGTGAGESGVVQREFFRGIPCQKPSSQEVSS